MERDERGAGDAVDLDFFLVLFSPFSRNSEVRQCPLRLLFVEASTLL